MCGMNSEWLWIRFTLSNCPLYLNVQWPFGFGLYGSNKPQSFKDENSGVKNTFISSAGFYRH